MGDSIKLRLKVVHFIVGTVDIETDGERIDVTPVDLQPLVLDPTLLAAPGPISAETMDTLLKYAGRTLLLRSAESLRQRIVAEAAEVAGGVKNPGAKA